MNLHRIDKKGPRSTQSIQQRKEVTKTNKLHCQEAHKQLCRMPRHPLPIYTMSHRSTTKTSEKVYKVLKLISILVFSLFANFSLGSEFIPICINYKYVTFKFCGWDHLEILNQIN